MKINHYYFIFLLLPFCSNAQWQLTQPLTESKFYLSATAAQGKIFFVGGARGVSAATKKMEIYALNSNTWTTRNLSIARAGVSAVEYGGKLYCAGGFTFTPASFATVDVYDLAADTFGLQHLSVARALMGSVAIGGKILFAGGIRFTVSGEQISSDVVDVYDPVTNIWTVDHLSQARGSIGVARIGNKAVFAGGMTSATTASDRVDIYDDATGQWSTATLSVPRGNTTVLAAGKYVLVAGGDSEVTGAWDVVDIWDSETNTWSTAALSEPRTLMAGAVAGDNAYFIGGGYADYAANFLTTSSARVDVFNATTGQWSANDLNQNRVGHAAAAWGNKVLVGGGWRPEQAVLTAAVETLTDPDAVSSSEPGQNPQRFSIVPNPAGDFIWLDNLSLNIHSVEIYNALGQLVATHEAGPGQKFMVSDWPKGWYTVQAKNEQGSCSFGRFLKSE